MIIKKLSIKNFGPFHGTAVFDLLPDDGGAKSVVLIGGDNGMGKTTILAAVKLCLYGKRCNDLWPVGQNAYRQYITRKFNNPAFISGEREIAFELQLMVWENRIEHELTVRRSYQLTDSRLFLNDNQEGLEVFRDGKVLEVSSSDALDQDIGNQYDELLRILIPSNFAQFYFFDGERVREIFDRPSSENISQAVRDLLNLTVFERVAEDLKKYRQFKLPGLYGKHQMKVAELRQRQAEQDSICAQIDIFKSQLAETRENLAEIDALIQAKEKEFVQMGGLHQTELDDLKEKERQINQEYDHLTKQLKEALADQISICFLLPLRSKLEERLTRKKSRKDWLLKRETIEPHIDVLVDRVFGKIAPKPTPPLSDEQAGFLARRLAEEVKKLFWPPPTDASDDIWFDFRDQDVGLIREQLEDAGYFSSNSLRDIVEAKNRVFVQRQRVQERLSSSGDSLFSQSVANEIKQCHEKKGSLLAKESDIKASMEHENRKLTEVTGQVTILVKETEKSAKGQVKEGLSRRVEEAVKEYVSVASVKKADDIERHLNQLFLSMANCRDVISHVKLDRHSYRISLVDVHDKERSIETGLSAGQSQVLAMAFVGALAKSSGRILPFIVDTPLGRLDVNHRQDVTEKFFIGQSPQTILLSTPTEINNCIYDERPLRLVDMLRPYVARAYTLVKESAEVTRVERNYFGDDLG